MCIYPIHGANFMNELTEIPGNEHILYFFGDSLCLLNFGINPNKIFKLGKYRPFLIGKQPVLGCKIGKIKSLIHVI